MKNIIGTHRIWITLAIFAVAITIFTASAPRAYAWYSAGSLIYGANRGGWGSGPTISDEINEVKNWDEGFYLINKYVIAEWQVPTIIGGLVSRLGCPSELEMFWGIVFLYESNGRDFALNVDEQFSRYCPKRSGW